MTDKPTLITIFGNSEHGKDSLAQLLDHRYWQNHPDEQGPAYSSFAYGVKRASMEMLGIPEDVAFGSQQVRASYMVYGRSVREWQQIIGTQMGREMIHQDVWVDRACDRAMKLTSSCRLVFVPDGRFYNELYVPKQRLGDAMRVVNILIRRLGHRAENVNHNHQSEAEVAGMAPELFDHYVLNDGDLERLAEQAEKLYQKIF